MVDSTLRQDRILIEGLAVETCIGVYDWEREIQQRLLFDLDICTDVRAAAAEDALAKTVDYKAVSDRVLEYVAQTDFELIETLAENLAELLIHEFQLSRLRLKLSKPGAVAEAKNIALMIDRGPADYE